MIQAPASYKADRAACSAEKRRQLMIKKQFVITIGRQYGSGGRLVGKRLAESLGINFYDENILKITSEKTAIGEQYFRLADEKAGDNLLYRIVKNMKPDIQEPNLDTDITSPENLFRFQAQVIREIGKTETCIIAGRCSNYVLAEAGVENRIDMFVHADMATRIRRVMDLLKVDEEEAIQRIRRIDKERSAYHLYYTGSQWMDPENYDIMINASRIDYDEMEILMREYIRMRGFID